MYPQKIVLTLLLICSFSLVLAENQINFYKIDRISESLLEETISRPEQFNKNSINRIQKNDAKLINDFNSLSLNEKYEVLSIVRKENLKKNGSNQTKEDLLTQYAVEQLIEEFKLDNIFINDISEIEFKVLLDKKITSLPISDLKAQLKSSCPLKNFPLSIGYVVKPSYSSYATAYYYSNVVNSVGEYPCDVELWYNISRDRVYGLNFLTRSLIQTGYGGNLAKRTLNGKDRIIIGSKRFLWGLSAYALSNNVAIW